MWHVSPNPLSADTVLNGFVPDAGYMFMVQQALGSGVPFLETLLQADVIAAAKTRSGLVLPSFVIEVIFEEVRAAEFEGRPSRLGAVHCFRSRAAAQRFTTHFRGGRASTYEVRAERAAVLHTFMDWVTPGIELRLPLTAQLTQMRDRARGYWRGDAPTPADYPEALAAGRVVVGRQVA